MAHVKGWQWNTQDPNYDDGGDISFTEHWTHCVLDVIDPQAEFVTFYENLYLYFYAFVLTISCAFVLIGVVYLVKANRSQRRITQSFINKPHHHDND